VTGDSQARFCERLGVKFPGRTSRRRLVHSVGNQPHQDKSQGPVAWIVGRKETEFRESIDKAIHGMVSESLGRNESERIGGLEKLRPRGRALPRGAKAAWNVAI
jgi:hypothetical protein